MTGNGNRYEGNYVNNRANGYGTLILDGTRYEGQWRNGCFGERGGGQGQAWIDASPEECGF